MTVEQLKHHVFVGVVEDNNDPKRLCRIKVRVMNIFDGIPVEDIPWATPWKDTGGEKGGAPSVGKVVSVIFDEGNPYKPEYLRAEHFNINLENKLKDISEPDYISFHSLMFDHSTQVYRTESEGLKLDHEYTNINLDPDGNIKLNLRDNESNVYIGSPDATQAAILGNHFMDWMDTFVDSLLSGAFIGNLGAPVVSNPQFIDVCTRYKLLRDPKFLSKRVWIVDNEQVETQSREYINQTGDKWQSNKTDNTLTTRGGENYAPQRNPFKSTPPGADEPVRDRSIKAPQTPDILQGAYEAEEKTPTISSDGVKNGRIPQDKLRKSQYLKRNLGGGHEFLRSDASKKFDEMMQAFEKADFPGKQKRIKFSDGYRPLINQCRVIINYGQEQCSKVYWTTGDKKGKPITEDEIRAAIQNDTLEDLCNTDQLRGVSPHGWGLAVDMHWGAGKTKLRKDVDSRQSAYKHPNYKWFLENGWKYGWYNPYNLRDDGRLDEWWHWEFHGIDSKTGLGALGEPGKRDVNGKLIGPPGPPQRYQGAITDADITVYKNYGGWWDGPTPSKLAQGGNPIV